MHELIEGRRPRSECHDGHERERDKAQERECAFQEEVGEGEWVVLIENRKGQRERGVMTDELDGRRRSSQRG